MGGIGSAVAIVLTYFFTEFLGIWYLFSYIIATIMAWTFNFYLNSLVTFRGHNKEFFLRQYLKFIGMYMVAFSANASLVFILTSLLHLYYIISIIIVTSFISFFTFWCSKKKVFIHDQVGDDIQK